MKGKERKRVRKNVKKKTEINTKKYTYSFNTQNGFPFTHIVDQARFLI